MMAEKGKEKEGKVYFGYVPVFMNRHLTSLVAQAVKHLPTIQETQVQFLGREDLLEKAVAGNPLQYSCLENPMDGGT